MESEEVPKKKIENRRKVILELWEKYQGACVLCGGPVRQPDPLDDPDDGSHGSKRSWASIDHITPRSKGGGNEYENLQLTHRGCNHARSSLSMEQWKGLILAGEITVHQNGYCSFTATAKLVRDAANPNQGIPRVRNPVVPKPPKKVEKVKTFSSAPPKKAKGEKTWQEKRFGVYRVIYPKESPAPYSSGPPPPFRPAEKSTHPFHRGTPLLKKGKLLDRRERCPDCGRPDCRQGGYCALFDF